MSVTIHDYMPNFYIFLRELVDCGDLLVELDASELSQIVSDSRWFVAEESRLLLRETVVGLVECVIQPSHIAEVNRNNTTSERNPSDQTSHICHSVSC